MNPHSKTTSEVRLISINDDAYTIKMVDSPSTWSQVHHLKWGHDSIFIRSNKHRREFEVYQQRSHKGSSTPLFYRPDDDSTIESIDLFKDFLVCWIRRNGLQQVLILNNETRHQQTVPFPDPTYEIYADVNPHFDASRFRLRYTSPIQPDIVLQYGHHCRHIRVHSQIQHPKLYPAEFRCERTMGNIYRRHTSPNIHR